MRYTVKIILRKEKTRQDGKAPLYLQVFVNKIRLRFPLYLYLKPEQFNAKTQLAKLPEPPKKADKELLKAHSLALNEWNDYNMILREAVSKANKIFVEYRLMQVELTSELFRIEYESQSARIDFIEYFEKALNKRIKEESISPRSGVIHKSILKKLKAYQPALYFNQFTHKFLTDFEAYMKKDLKNGVNTRWTCLRTVRTYFYIALNSGAVKIHNPFKTFKLKKAKGKIVYLETFERDKLEEMYDNPETDHSHFKVLRCFLASCNNGLRISDVHKVSDRNLVNDSLVFLPSKTRHKEKFVTVPLNKKAFKYIDRNKVGPLFETFSDQATNRILKEIAELAGINKKITFHVARHTFATLFLENGGAVEVLQELMGHEDIKTTMVYVHISEKRKKEQMKKFNK